MTTTPGNPGGAETQLDPVGIGGWLLLPAIGLIVSPFLSAFIIFGMFFVLSAGFNVIILLAIIVDIVFLVWMIEIAWLFFHKDPEVPDALIAFFVLRFVVVIGFAVLAWLHTGVSLAYSDVIRMIIQGLLCIIWVSYFLRSVRVRNTFWGGANSSDAMKRPRRSIEEILSDRTCPRCNSRLRQAQVDLMIGNPKYQPWCRGGYCSPACFERGSGPRRAKKSK